MTEEKEDQEKDDCVHSVDFIYPYEYSIVKTSEETFTFVVRRLVCLDCGETFETRNLDEGGLWS